MRHGQMENGREYVRERVHCSHLRPLRLRQLATYTTTTQHFLKTVRGIYSVDLNKSEGEGNWTVEVYSVWRERREESLVWSENGRCDLIEIR